MSAPDRRGIPLYQPHPGEIGQRLTPQVYRAELLDPERTLCCGIGPQAGGTIRPPFQPVAATGCEELVAHLDDHRARDPVAARHKEDGYVDRTHPQPVEGLLHEAARIGQEEAEQIRNRTMACLDRHRQVDVQEEAPQRGKGFAIAPFDVTHPHLAFGTTVAPALLLAVPRVAARLPVPVVDQHPPGGVALAPTWIVGQTPHPVLLAGNQRSRHSGSGLGKDLPHDRSRRGEIEKAISPSRWWDGAPEGPVAALQ